MSYTPITNLLQEIKAQLSATKSYADTSAQEKTLRRSLGDSLSENDGQINQQLSKLIETQKRFSRNQQNSFENLIDIIGLTKGQGSNTIRYLRRKLLEIAVKIEPQIKTILKNETIKALGCDQNQTYLGVDKSSLDQTPLSSRPINEGIYIPLSQIDFFDSLKYSPESDFGKVFYERQTPSVGNTFVNYGGSDKFPMNREIYDRMSSENQGRSFKTEFGKYYQGSSLKDLFDFEYVKTNQYGVSGDYLRLILIDRGESGNKIFEFIEDYYSTINVIDPVTIGAQIVNILSNAVNISMNLGSSQIQNQTKFYLMVQRVFGLCFDSRREIDVSGISKVGELDVIDDDFFTPNQSDLREIDSSVDLCLSKSMEFKDCGNLRLPVNTENIIDQLSFLRQKSGTTVSEEVDKLEEIIDSIHTNEDWKLYTNFNFDFSLKVNTESLKKLPLAVAAGVISPKNLLPIFTMIQVIEQDALNNLKSPLNLNQTFNDLESNESQINNLISDAGDYLTKFKTFNINLVSKIGAIFLKALYDELKKDIILLLTEIISDIRNELLRKKLDMYLTLIQIPIAVLSLVDDYRKCKSLLDNIFQLLKLINSAAGRLGPVGNVTGFIEIPEPLVALSGFLPGKSPTRSTINTIKLLQSFGIPTGPMPDGSINLMSLYSKAIHLGADQEERTNGKVLIAPNLLRQGLGFIGKSV